MRSPSFSRTSKMIEPRLISGNAGTIVSRAPMVHDLHASDNGLLCHAHRSSLAHSIAVGRTMPICAISGAMQAATHTDSLSQHRDEDRRHGEMESRAHNGQIQQGRRDARAHQERRRRADAWPHGTRTARCAPCLASALRAGRGTPMRRASKGRQTIARTAGRHAHSADSAAHATTRCPAEPDR